MPGKQLSNEERRAAGLPPRKSIAREQALAALEAHGGKIESEGGFANAILGKAMGRGGRYPGLSSLLRDMELDGQIELVKGTKRTYLIQTPGWQPPPEETEADRKAREAAEAEAVGNAHDAEDGPGGLDDDGPDEDAPDNLAHISAALAGEDDPDPANWTRPLTLVDAPRELAHFDYGKLALELLLRASAAIASGADVDTDLLKGRIAEVLAENQHLRQRATKAKQREGEQADLIAALKIERDRYRSAVRDLENNINAMLRGGRVDASSEHTRRELERMVRQAPHTGNRA